MKADERRIAAPQSAETPPGPVRVTIRSHGGRIASVPQIDFMGQYATSPSGRFTLLWSDRMMINGELRGGRYVLIDDGRVVLDRAMDRPQDGKVADRGVFVLNDWGSSEDLSGRFHAFTPDGRELIARAFAANLLNNGLAPAGHLAVCQTCNAPGSPDNSVLCVFDLVAGREIACWTPQSGWADGYEFPASGDRVRMLRRDREPVDYSLEGEFLDRRKWFADEIARGTYYVIRDALKAGEAVTGLTLAQLRDGANVAIGDADERFKAENLRLLGEIEEKAGDARAALFAYREALAINPKVGVAKRAAALAKTLGV
jgi:hypothetical protein